VLTFFPPTDAALATFAHAKRNASLSYSNVGCTAEETQPPGFWRDESRVALGTGREFFDAACELVARGEFYPPEMLPLFALRRPFQPDDVVLNVYRVSLAPVPWLVMPTRILNLFDEVVDSPEGRIHRSGFTYGTLEGHAECGEERFAVEWEEATDCVSFSIVAVSRPASWFVWLGVPFARREQARFRRLASHRLTQLVARAVRKGAAAC
jgi:uncharacterized protein (UPF0548 family)